MTSAKNNFQKSFYRIQKICYKNIGFTFIELIIVVTIIAILSISAWTSLTGETDKARDAKRLQDLSQMQQALEQYYIKNSFYPQPAARDIDKQKYAWGYRSGFDALASCRTKFDPALNAIDFENTYCGGDIKDVGKDDKAIVIGWKGVINETSGKNSVAIAKGKDTTLLDPFDASYIQNIGRDPKLGGVAEWAEKGVGDYIYAVYRGEKANEDVSHGAIQYQLATTLEKGGPDARQTYIVGNYTQKRGKLKDPYSLIGSGENVLLNEQKIGENNSKVLNKSDDEKKFALETKIQTFKEAIKNLKDETSEISSDAAKFLTNAEDLLDKDVTKYVTDGLFGDAEKSLNDIRGIIKEAISRFYRDSSKKIYDNLKEAVRNDQTEQLKADLIAQIKSISSIVKEIQRNAKNTRFDDIQAEFKVRKELDRQLASLVDNELATMLETLGKNQDSAVDIIDESLQNSFPPARTGDEEGEFSGLEADLTTAVGAELTIDTNEAGVFKGVAYETNRFIEAISDIRKSLLEVDKQKKIFKIQFSDIKIDINDLQDKVTDLDKKAKEVAGAPLTKRDIEELAKELGNEQDSKRRLTLVLEAESKFSNNPPREIAVTFDETMLGESAGQAGTAHDSFNPLSDYSGVPFPLEISG